MKAKLEINMFNVNKILHFGLFVIQSNDIFRSHTDHFYNAFAPFLELESASSCTFTVIALKIKQTPFFKITSFMEKKGSNKDLERHEAE